MTNPGDVAMPYVVFETEPHALRNHIQEVTGIQPDARSHIPRQETKELIAGVQAKDPVAITGMVAARLSYLYKYIGSSQEIISRDDLTLAEVLGMSSLAIIESAREVNVDAEQISPLLAVRSTRHLGKLLTGSRLIPALGEGTQQVIGIANGNEERIRDQATPVGGRADVIAVTAQDRNRGAAEADPEAAAVMRDVMRSVLREREEYVVRATYGLDSDMMNGQELSHALGVASGSVSFVRTQALRKLRAAYEDLDNPQPEEGKTRPHWSAGREALRQQWLEEIKAKQEAGGIAFVTGSLLSRPLPSHIEEYLSSGRFGHESGYNALRSALKATPQQIAMSRRILKLRSKGRW